MKFSLTGSTKDKSQTFSEIIRSDKIGLPNLLGSQAEMRTGCRLSSNKGRYIRPRIYIMDSVPKRRSKPVRYQKS
jgi:hypothetical protein